MSSAEEEARDAGLRIVAGAIPALAAWAAKELAGGRDPQAKLDALMAAEESAAIELERQRFGGG